eukprot:TRINITY_DN9530_c0_g1_i1.p2 TRINITY_DN9530_c0_g1~~TRINITY_DN9530_c0_g1_i1.p2  ORF type:complete len:107 (-),score=7.16 TRINITY_DN9530_c0_g1_i1:591-911(-)
MTSGFDSWSALEITAWGSTDSFRNVQTLQPQIHTPFACMHEDVYLRLADARSVRRGLLCLPPVTQAYLTQCELLLAIMFRTEGYGLAIPNMRMALPPRSSFDFAAA